jgi:hypothetical protein
MKGVTHMPRKSGRFDRITRDYEAKLDDNIVGYYASYNEAMAALDKIVYARLSKAQPVRTEVLEKIAVKMTS